MKTKIGYIGTLKAKPGKRDELAALLQEAADILQSANGCIQYLIAQESADAYTVTVLEIWDSLEDHNISLEIPGCRELMNRAMPLLDGPPESKILQITGGKMAQ